MIGVVVLIFPLPPPKIYLLHCGSGEFAFFQCDELLCDLTYLLISHISTCFWKTWTPSLLLFFLHFYEASLISVTLVL